MPLPLIVFYLKTKLQEKFKPLFTSSSLTNARRRDAELAGMLKKSYGGVDKKGKPRDKSMEGVYLPPILTVSYEIEKDEILREMVRGGL